MSAWLPAREPDCEAVVRLLPTAEGGRSKPAFTGYRPAHSIRGNYLSTGTHEYLDSDRIEPGASGRARIWFIRPAEYPGTLRHGQELRLQEGGRWIGFAKITAVLNPTLLAENG